MTKTEKATRHFNKHLSHSEKLLWVGIPKVTPYSLVVGLSLCFALLGLSYLIYLRLDLEPSFSNFFYALYSSIPTIICIAIAVIFSRKEHEAYGFTEQQVLIKKGSAELTSIRFQDIINVASKSTFLGWSFDITVLVAGSTEKTIVHPLYTVPNGEIVDKKLRSYLKK